MISVFVLIACFILAPAGVRAQSGSADSLLDQVTECDILAGHPEDADRMTEGVADDAIVPRLAIQACEAAHKDNPKDGRIAFQLGRAYLAVGKHTEALKYFQVGADAHSGAAWAYLGDAYQFGHGVPANNQKAFDAYKTAYEKGFKRARSA